MSTCPGLPHPTSGRVAVPRQHNERDGSQHRNAPALGLRVNLHLLLTTTLHGGRRRTMPILPKGKPRHGSMETSRGRCAGERRSQGVSSLKLQNHLMRLGL